MTTVVDRSHLMAAIHHRSWVTRVSYLAQASFQPSTSSAWRALGPV